MKKDSSECQQRILRKLFRNNKPQLPVMNIPGTRKTTQPFPVGKRTTRSETLRVKSEKVPATHGKPDNEPIVESTDNQSDAKNVPHSKSNVQMEAMEGTEEKKKPRKKRISRALFRHDAIDYIKPKKQELLQKSFSLGFKKLVDKSKEIIFKNDDNENEDKTKEKDCETDNIIDKPPKSAEPISGKATQNMEHLLLDMPSLDSPCSSENIQQNTEQNNTGNIPKASSTEAQIQLNNSQDLLYQFYGLIPNKSSMDQNDNEQAKKYNINIVPNTRKTIEIDKRTVPPNTSKIAVDQFVCPQNIPKHNFDARNQFIYPRFPYFHPNMYGYYGYPFIPQNYPQHIVKNINNIENKLSCTVVKESTNQKINNNDSKIPLIQNIQHRHRNDDNNSNYLKRTAESHENNNNKRICVNNNSKSSNSSNLQTPVNNKIEKTTSITISNNEKSVIVSPKSKECSVIKKITSNKNQHTIENILAHKSNKEVNNNNKINITNIEIIPTTDPRYNNQKSVIISPKTDEKNTINSLNNETNNIKYIKMPKLIKIPEEFHNSTNRNTTITSNTDTKSTKTDTNTKTSSNSDTKHAHAQNKPTHCDLVSKVNKECKQHLPLNLSLKNADERQPVIVNNTQNDPLNVEILTLVKSEEEYNGYLKLLEEKKATGPYLFYKFIASVRKKNNQPMFDLLSFFVLLKQGKLVDYKNMYNNCFK